MRSKLLIITGILFLFSACNPEEETEIIELSVSTNIVNAPSEGGSYKVSVSTNAAWEVEVDYNDYKWCSVESDPFNNDTIYIEVERTDSETLRETLIIVKNSSVNNDQMLSDTINIMQEGWNVTEEGVLINGTIWAKYNVDDFGTFAESPEYTGKLYQFNNSTAYATLEAGGLLVPKPNWSPASSADAWLSENNPCPSGWRLPTSNEVYALVKSGYKYDSTLQGFFFGKNSESAGLEDSKGCIFLPAGGFIQNGDVVDIFLAGHYWVSDGCSPGDDSVLYRYLHLYNDDSQSGLAELASVITHDISYAFSIRCVKE